MDSSALARQRQTLQAAVPIDAQRNDDDNNYLAELFAQLTNPEFFTSDASDVNDFGQKYQFASEAGVARPEKRDTKRSRQEAAEAAQENTSEESSQHRPEEDFNAPFGLDVLGFDMLDFNTLAQLDNFNPPFNFPESTSSVHAGGMNLPVTNANIRIPEAPLPINPFTSCFGSARGDLLNNSYVGSPFNTTGRITRQVPEDVSMMPWLVSPPPFSGMQGSSSVDVFPSVGCQPLPSQQQQQRSTKSNGKRQRRRSASPPAPQIELQFVHDELSMPSDFRANPNNHARFKYHRDGTREYLNAPKKRRKQPCPVRDSQFSD